MIMNRKFLLLAGLIALGATCSTVRADPILINGGFETGDFSGWSHSGGVIISDQEGSNSPPYAAVFNPAGGPANGVISQTFATMVGQAYQLSFSYGVYGAGGGSQEIEVTVTDPSTRVDSTVNAGTGTGNTDYTSSLNSFSWIAGGTSSTLTFTDKSTGYYDGISSSDGILDTVSVTPAAVPEPSSIAMCGIAGLIGVGCAWRRRRRARLAAIA